ncbi:DEAD/DEAH box helicase family protein [Lysinibacillus fusiformis]|uniref:DEAD/DEAH box helicase family protein n=1 Tax=Lysinibacillus fusiformis TaxID=28031 RepID=UPI000D349A88|nr:MULTISPECIES: DEAD/DEAH box helicase family protein [Lysinibacillus]MED4672108.1 DEAD/DEAH box helicase family protein [Lysinibacillus fusiformis]QAS57424.1 hypothetical protein LSP_14240 [Lysinibacillus sphaericus]RDV26979.1 hypothetical protein C7B90_19970 [Lysinibacillus fusiformis]GED65142.1 hypothetical protein LFU01_35940 [Lysinibacillus fusiformis]
MTNITVIDSIMGSGKTEYAIQHMNESNQLESFIFVTPFLDEIQRIKESVTERQFVEPTVFNGTNKLEDLKRLIASNRDIATTHKLFSKADDEIIELLEHSGYTLILDEVMDIVETVAIRPADIRRLKLNGDIVVDEKTFQVTWTGDPNDDSRYRDIRELAQAGNLYLFRTSFMVWAFPPAVFRAFPNALVLTYLFKCQMQKYYFNLYRFEFDYKAVEKQGERYELIEHDVYKENRGKLRGLVTLYEGKLNDVGVGRNELSQSKLKKYDDEKMKRIRDNVSNYFRRYAENAKASEVYISTLQEVERELAPRGYSVAKCFIPHNARATNEYANRRAVAYLLNRFMNRDKAAFFQDHGISVNEDLYALSEFVQWLWRSRIREGEPIHAYVPSQRMRQLFERWAKYEI